MWETDDLKIVFLTCVKMGFNSDWTLLLQLGRHSKPSPHKITHIKLTWAVMSKLKPKLLYHFPDWYWQVNNVQTPFPKTFLCMKMDALRLFTLIACLSGIHFTIIQGSEWGLERILHNISYHCVHWCDFSDIKSERTRKLEDVKKSCLECRK